MSTSYRVRVTCDERASKDCHKQLLLATTQLHRLAGHTEIVARGWRRGYSDAGTHDICPACVKALGHTEQTPAVGTAGKENTG